MKTWADCNLRIWRSDEGYETGQIVGYGAMYLYPKGRYDENSDFFIGRNTPFDISAVSVLVSARFTTASIFTIIASPKTA